MVINGPTLPSGAGPASDIDFRTNIIKATLISNIKFLLEDQSGLSQTI